MARYIVRRLIYMLPVTLVLSFVCFLVIDLAPGDFVSVYESSIRANLNMTEAEKEAQLRALGELRVQYGLDRPVLARYAAWMFNIVTRGDFGYSFQVARPVHTLILERVGWTILMSVLGLMVGLTASFTLGIFSARHQYSLFDYVANVVAFLGMATPGFFLALIFMTVMVFVFGEQVGGLFSSEYVNAPWSLAKAIDLLKHLSIPLAVGLVTGAGAGMRIIRGNLLDKLNRPYVQTARAKGLPERLVVYRHALRNALHPWVMGMSNTLSELISGDTIISIVLALPTVGLMFYDGLIRQDSYVAGTFLLMATILLQVGTLLADIVLAWLDPTVRFE